MANVGYARVSTLGQLEKGAGLEVQAEKIERFCEFASLDGLELIQEQGSGIDSERPGLLRALKTVLISPGSTLIVYRLDRLGRSALDVQENVQALLDRGVRIVSVSEGIDSESGMGRAMLRLLVSILSTFAELERETITQRLHDGRQRAKSEGKAYTRHAPYGFRKTSEGEIEEDPDEQATLALARSLRATGHTLDEIADLLPLNREGRRFSRQSVLRMVTGAKTVHRKPQSNRTDRVVERLIT